MVLFRSRALFRWRRFVAAPLLFLTLLACAPDKAREGRGVLSPAPADQVNSAAAAQAFPFNETLGSAGFARTVFHSTGPANTEITVRDAIVGPHAEAQLPASAGPLLIDLKSGSGSADAGGKTTGLSEQQPASFPANVAITLKNGGGTPLVVRLYVLEGK
jgi:hypothetical protein